MKVRNKKIYYSAEQWFQGKEIENVFEKDEDTASMIAPNKDNVFEICAYLKTKDKKILVKSGNWILTDKYNEKFVVDEEDFNQFFEKISEQYIYEPLEIPSFDGLNLNENEITKCKKMFEEVSKVLRENCDLMEIHLGFYVACKINEEVKKSMEENLNSVLNEVKRRGLNEN